ncbi:sigma 54-interacting transcriptional regulator [Brevibacillus choshinensis]|uniref:sigma 54-interacting transcriptional regulator n=1 Tax=Brevibacillus choshinensis TaxID=54911 RepID=UPI002E1AC044|nr:sigma 54-interacting transcriptional regulator [Brevibacillus choshinensis]MED4779693.1 sigma 54-interacting transcriptional regulator [Brevibacillus choshinensis]
MLRIRDYCTKDIVKLRSSHRIADVLNAFLHSRLDIACILDDSDRLMGIISKNALYRALLHGATLDTPIEPYIRQHVVTADADDNLDHVRDIMLQNQVAHGVILDEKGYVLGVMSKSDIIRGFLHEKEVLINWLSDLIEHLQDVVVSINSESQIATFNRAAENIFGLTKQQVTGQSVDNWLPQLSDGLETVLQQHCSMDPRRISIGNHTVIASFIPLSHNKSVNGAMAVLQDITTLEAVAKELESTKNLQHTVQHALALSYDAIIMTDVKGFITNINDAFLELFELKNEALINRHWLEVIPELNMEAVLAGQTIEGGIRTIREKPCFVIQEPINRNGIHLGTITKIIFRQLDEWRDVFRRLEQLESEIHYYREELQRANRQSSAFDQIISQNSNLERLKEQALLAAKSTSTILITGESGTGKELFAEAIHRESKRVGNFIQVNCAAIPGELLESEFFGYAEGAFTGARKGGKLGKFEIADHGTLFLDEIGDMPLSLQAKLLRVLQEQSFERIGDVKTRKVDVRIIAATNKNLRQMVKEGTFREDLYYRIDVVNLSLPPLRERMDDLSLLSEFLVKKLNKKLNKEIIGITTQALMAMQEYLWPGNVRELENVLERTMNMDVKQWIEPQHLPEQIRQRERSDAPPLPVFIHEREDRPKESHSLEEMEKHMIMSVLDQTQNNRTEAARLLGISRSNLYQKIRKYGIKQEVRFHMK